VQVKAASLNYRDLLMVRGQYDPNQALPLVPLSDGVGVVDAIGDGVVSVSVGQRVAGLFAQAWTGGTPTPERLRSTLGGPRDGMLAESVLLDEHGAVSVPEHLSDVEAATLPCAAVTAWSAVVRQGHVRAGDTVLVQGTGGVSSFALDFARMHGARVIATSSSAEKRAFLEERGAWKTVDYTQDAKWGRTVRALTDGRGVDLVVEVGGAGTLQQSLRAVRPGGTVALIGVLAGGAAELNLTSVLMNNVRVQGVFVGSREDFEAMNRALTLHATRPWIDRVFAFDEAHAAFEYLATARHKGKVCIAMA
jgi:NADPH:quinone reductase-like Zn-dependent oxidoreductase